MASRKKYASSVYSQKSTTSAKSGRSFLSLGGGDKAGVWRTMKQWLPSATAITTKRSSVSSSTSSMGGYSSSNSSLRRMDVDAMTIQSTASSMSSSTATSSASSYKKWKRFLFNPVVNHFQHPEDNASNKSGSTSTTTTSFSGAKPPLGQEMYETPTLNGILVHHGGSAEEIEEQRRRRRRRRLYLMRAQQQESSGRPVAVVGFREMGDSSSSSTLLSTPPDQDPDHRKLGHDDHTTHTFHDELTLQHPQDNEEDDEHLGFTPRVMFVEPSPVPRFRNEPPAPPPTPPYLSVLVQPGDLFANASSQEENAQNAQNEPMTPSLRPSVASMTRKPRLVFQSPLYRGQAIPFALHNTLPDDHLIIFKFLTSSSSSNSSSHATAAHTHATATMHASSDAHHQERYYVRPSSGKIDAFQADILLILNQIPPLASGATLKDKILVRWAVVQRGTQVEQWVQQQLTEKTRRKWLEMLLETWPDQVMERKTRLSIRFT